MPRTALDDPSAQFDALFTATHWRVLAYVVRRGAAPADADDVVADVYVVAWRRFEDVSWDDPLPWLIGVAQPAAQPAAHAAAQRRPAAAAAQ